MRVAPGRDDGPAPIRSNAWSRRGFLRAGSPIIGAASLIGNGAACRA